MSKYTSSEWEYRVVRKSERGDKWLSIQEVYYDDDKKPMAHTVDLQADGDNIADIRTTLQRMLWCIDKDIVEEIQSDIMEDNMEDRVLSLEIENAEMKDRLTELGDQLEETNKVRSL